MKFDNQQATTDTGQLQLAVKILESGAQRLEALKLSSRQAVKIQLSSLTVEYFGLRIRIVGTTLNMFQPHDDNFNPGFAARSPGHC